MKVWKAWFELSAQATQLGWEAQNVIDLRIMRMAAGGDSCRSEARRMITEKIDAAVEAQCAGAAAAFAGGDGHCVTEKVMGIYRERVLGNARRLAHSG